MLHRARDTGPRRGARAARGADLAGVLSSLDRCMARLEPAELNAFLARSGVAYLLTNRSTFQNMNAMQHTRPEVAATPQRQALARPQAVRGSRG